MQDSDPYPDQQGQSQSQDPNRPYGDDLNAKQFDLSDPRLILSPHISHTRQWIPEKVGTRSIIKIFIDHVTDRNHNEGGN